MKSIPAAMIFGGGEYTGTDSFTDLTHKPRINDVELSGSKSAADLGLANSDDVYTKTEVDDLLDDKADIDDVDLIVDTLNIKKWNQIIKNGNFVDTSDWSQHGGSITAENNILTFVQSGSDIQIIQSKNLVNNHKYFCSFTAKSNSNSLGLTVDNVSSSPRLALVCDNEWHTCETIFTANNDYTASANPYFYGLGTEGDTVQLKNVMIIDLTDLYGAGNEPTAEQFRKMFPNEYYDYNAGVTINGLVNLINELHSTCKFVKNTGRPMSISTINRYGNLVSFLFEITLDTDLTERLFIGTFTPKPKQEYAFFNIMKNNLADSWVTVANGFIRGSNGQMYIEPIEAGSYFLQGTYICE